MSKAAEAPATEVPVVPPGVSIANHPRARASIRRTRARVALATAPVVLWLALNAGVPPADAVLRALMAGVAGFLIAWAVGLVVWKQIVMGELRLALQKRERRRQALVQAAADRAAAAR